MKSKSCRHLFQLTALTLALAACEANYTAEEHLRRAQEAEARGDLQASLIELKNAAQKDPKNAQARLLLARHYLKAGQGAEAEKELKRARELGQDWDGLKPLYADALLQQGEFQRVLDEVTLGIATSRADRASILRAHGDANLGLRQPEQGCPLYQDALKLDPKQVEAYWGLSRCALLERKPEQAKAQLQAALQAVPDHPGSWARLGDLERGMNNAEGAIEAYGTALKHEPRHRQALMNRGQLYVLGGKTKEAEADLATLKKIEPGYYGTHFLEALLHYAAGRTDPALEAVQRVIKTRPDYLPAQLLLAHLQYDKGQLQTAVSTLNAFLQAAPGHPQARKLLAAAHIRLNQPERALELLRPMIAANPGDAQALALAGEARLRQDDPTAARELFAQAASSAPENPVLAVKLGLSALAAGDESQGVRTLETAARAGKTPLPDLALAYHFLAENRPEQALAILTQVEGKLPNNPGVHNLKGMAYAGMNDLNRARQSYERALSLKPDLTSAALRLASLDLRENKPDQARARYEAILRRDKGNVPALVGLAELAAAQNREKDYLARLEEAVKADPAALVPRAMLADYHIGKKQPQQALAHAREAAQRNPNRPEALALLGKIQLAAGERQNALSTYNKLTAMSPKSAEAHYQLAQAQAAQADEKAVRASLLKALQLDPGHLGARAALSGLEARTGRTAEALRLARDLQGRAPHLPLGYVLEGDALLIARRPAEAATAYEQALKRGRDGGLIIKAHRALQLAGQNAKADDLLRGWLQAQPQDARARAYLAEAHMQRGQLTEARREYEALLAARPDDALVLNNLALIHLRQGDPRALELAERAYRLQPSSPVSADTLGWILTRRGQTERGLKLLEQAHAADARHPEVRYHYAYALHQAGKTAQARQVLAPLQSAKLPPELQAAVRELARQLP
jgi:putative PEP-CTERM system TPR-repeat lipoprotein